MESNESKLLRIEEKFQDHVLTEIINTDNIKVFDFKRPESITYSQRWVISGDRLIVTGDCYDSIYRWSGNNNLTLDFLSSCDLSYFNSKCTADKDGYDQKHYDDDHASLYMKRLASDNIFNNIENYIKTDEQDEKFNMDINQWDQFNVGEKFEMIREFIEEESDSYLNADSMFIRENEVDAIEFMSENEFMFGEEAWEHEQHLLSYTPTPFHHLAALRVANTKYPNFF